MGRIIYKIYVLLVFLSCLAMTVICAKSKDINFEIVFAMLSIIFYMALQKRED